MPSRPGRDSNNDQPQPCQGAASEKSQPQARERPITVGQSQGSGRYTILPKVPGCKPPCAGGKNHHGNEPGGEVAASESGKVKKKEVNKYTKGCAQREQEEAFPIESQGTTPELAAV